MLLPNMFFKYKALNTKEDLIRTIDIINNNRLYMPCRKQVNDPFECTSVTPKVEGVMGMGTMYAADLEPNFLEDGRDRFRLLSFSEECFSPQMWAYYCSDYTGLCFGFVASESFAKAKAVKYTNTHYLYSDKSMGPSMVRESVREALFIKQDEWRHEKEWRIISEEDDCYFEFKKNELRCIILGYRINEETKSFLKDLIPQTVPILIAMPGMISFKIYFQPINYVYPTDGSERPQIKTVSELISYCDGNDRERWINEGAE